MPASTKGPEIRHRRLRWFLGTLIVTASAFLGFWVFPRSPRLPVRATLKGSDGAGRPLDFSSDGSMLATGHASGNILLWDSMTGKLRTRLTHHGNLDLTAVFSPDSRMLAVISNDMRTRLHKLVIFELTTGRELAGIDVPGPIICHLRFTPDSSSLNVIRWNNGFSETDPWQLISWDTATWSERENRLLPLKQTVGPVAFSRDGRVMAAGGRNDPSVTLWDTGTGKQLAALARHDSPSSANVWSVSYSPDGGTLAIGRTDGNLELWDLRTRSLRAELRGHSKGYSPQYASFATSRETIVSMGMNWNPPPILDQVVTFALTWASPRGQRQGTKVLPPPEVILWDVASRRPQVMLMDSYLPILSPDGKIMATTGPGGAITLWDIPAK